VTSLKAPASLAEIGPFGKQPLSDNERAARTAFALLWKRTIQDLTEIAWETIHPGSVSQLYVEDGPSDKLQWVLASPSNELLYVRLNFVSPEFLRESEPKFHGLMLEGYQGMTVSTEHTTRTSGTEWFLEARIGMARLFDNCTSANMMEARLRNFVVPLIELAS
jgi:hypothetical protein